MSETKTTRTTLDINAGTGTTTYTFGPKSYQPGICAKHNLEHAWEPGPTLTTNPPIYTRRCKNCGQEQRQYPALWKDFP